MFEGCGFESQHRILDEYFFTHICCTKIVIFVRKDKIKEKKRQEMAI